MNEDQPGTPETGTDTPSATQKDGGAPSLADRLGLEGLDYEIPAGAMKLPYLLGGLTAFFLLMLVGTGIYLAQYYNPSAAGAHDSVIYIITRAPLGDWVRSLHYWSAGGVVFAVIAHLAVVFRRRAYRRPRELTWMAGVGMAGVLFMLLVTGSALRYDQEGFEALAHFVAGGELTGMFGRFFTPDFTLSVPLLPRIYSLHVSLLPLALFGILGLHFWLIRQLGIHSNSGNGTTTFRRHAIKLTGVGLLGWAAVGVLAALAPEGLGYPAVAGVEITKPMWPVLWIYGLENMLGAWGMILGPSLVFAFLFAVPLLDRKDSGDERGSGWVGWLGIVLAVIVFALWLYGRFGEAQQHIGM
jgi:quinol-cytochrome oxidoreductase complex cytochrome b subunit